MRVSWLRWLPALVLALGFSVAARAQAEVTVSAEGGVTTVAWTKATIAEIVSAVAAKGGQDIEFRETADSQPVLTGSWQGGSVEDFIGLLLGQADHASYPSNGHDVTIVFKLREGADLLHGHHGAAPPVMAEPARGYVSAGVSRSMVTAEAIQEERATAQTAMFLKSAGLDPSALKSP